ncbi:DUF3892 domain-containing protein [Chitinophaga filiformis]|uniref:DUF3892 domain-containing protein n=1 Tax=Chitinophaga filiformis TaxID=104663 RepID=A0ABY4I8P3_CHIFI|nr:DUF3892 domain-containing protein [Chitinophaga filiformis]UPK72454.1 DUF3892 domain-containing protein [Chitinophaga filiformis]
MARYYITAIRKSNNGSHISHVLVHSTTGEGRLGKGTVYSKAQIISFMVGHTFQTVTYNYSDGSWRIGADVGKVRVAGVDYLRTDRDSTARDNLGNLLLIDELR